MKLNPNYSLEKYKMKFERLEVEPKLSKLFKKIMRRKK